MQNKAEESKPRGLSTEEVNERIASGQINKTNLTVGKSYGRIIADNLFSFFNIVLYVIAAFMLYAGYYSGLLFMVVLVPNIAIGLYEDIKARKLMDKLHVLNSPKALVVRNGKEQTILGEEIVKDDVVILGANNQICADGTVILGDLAVNESLLTGEPDNIYKKTGDVVYSGSYVVNGRAYIHIDKVGNDSYVQQLQGVAKKFKRSKSEILRSLKSLFKKIGGTVIVMALAMIITYAIQGKFSNVLAFKKAIGPMSGSLVAMIPTGLYLLTSVALATAVINLSRKHAHVQDFYSVEMLARTDVLCVDKTGTITDGTMVVKNIIPLVDVSENKIKDIIFKVLNATGDTNATAVALLNSCTGTVCEDAMIKLPFTSENKYSGASFKEGTYLIGAPEFINLSNKSITLRRAEEYTSKGFRVLVLAKGNEQISSKSYEKPCESLAIIVLQDHIKEDAKKTFEWFKENDVSIRVISGDNAVTVSEIAKSVGIDYADKYISLEGMSIDEVKAIANKYYVFGRVSPQQKAALVEALQAEKHTVAMTGDGVNDILALKKADCSIAMASGAEASRNVSHIVLMNSNFSCLPDVVSEGRRVVNNLQRTCSLFLVKTIFAVFTTLIFLVASIIMRDPSIEYPFVTNHLYIWETVALGLPAFFLALQPNSERINGKFLGNIYRTSIPAGITVLLGEFSIFFLYTLFVNFKIYTGITSYNQAINMAVLFISGFSLVVLFKVCYPLDKYRFFVFLLFTLIAIGCIGFSYMFFVLHKGNLFRIDFSVLSGFNYFVTAMVLILTAVLFFVAEYIIEVIEGKHIDEDE